MNSYGLFKLPQKDGGKSPFSGKIKVSAKSSDDDKEMWYVKTPLRKEVDNEIAQINEELEDLLSSDSSLSGNDSLEDSDGEETLELADLIKQNKEIVLDIAKEDTQATYEEDHKEEMAGDLNDKAAKLNLNDDTKGKISMPLTKLSPFVGVLVQDKNKM